MKSVFCYLRLSAVLLLFTFHQGNAQDPIVKKKVIPYLHYLERAHDVYFSFDPDLLTGKELELSEAYEELQLREALQVIQGQSDLVIQAIDEKHWIIQPPSNEIQICAILVDEVSGDPILGGVMQTTTSRFPGSSNVFGHYQYQGNLNPQDSVQFKFFSFESDFFQPTELAETGCDTISLNIPIVHLDEVVLHNYLGSGIHSAVEDHSLKLHPEDMSLLPGQTSGDVLQALSVLPGISSPNGKAGNLFLRGSTSDQTLVFFDDVPFYNKGHYFGTISPFNQQAIESIRIYRSGVHPSVGGRVGGTIDIRSSSEIADSATGAVGVSMTNAMGFVRFPLVKNRLGVMVSGRRALPHSWQTPRQASLLEFVEQGTIMGVFRSNPERYRFERDIYDFSDFQSKLIFDATENDKITVSFVHTRNFDLQEVYDSSGIPQPSELYRNFNNGLNAKWQRYWNDRIRTNLSITGSRFQNLIELKLAGDTDPIRRFDMQIEDFFIKAGARIEDAEGVNYLETGYNLDRHLLHLNTFEELPGMASYDSTQQLGFIHSVYGNFHLRSVKRLLMNMGMRLCHYNLSDEWYMEPRLFLNYEVGKHINAKFAGGIYHQFIEQLIFFDFEDTKPENNHWGLANGNRPPAESQQVMLGGVYAHKGWTIDLEGFFKDIEPIHFSGGFGPEGTREYPGRADMQGINLYIKKELRRIQFWATYSWTEVDWHFEALSEEAIDAYYDQPHSLSLGTIFKRHPWALSGVFSYSSGVPDQFVRVGLGPPMPGMPPSPLGIDYFGTQDAHHQLDVSAAYTFVPQHQQWKLVTSVSIQNVYDQRTLLEVVPLMGQETETRMLGFSPNAQILLKF